MAYNGERDGLGDGLGDELGGVQQVRVEHERRLGGRLGSWVDWTPKSPKGGRLME